MAKASNEPVFTDNDMTVETYRVFSPTSLLAFLISGFTSLIGLVNSSLVILPIFALLFAIFSLIKLTTIKGRVIGWTMTALAVAMPIFAITTPFVYKKIRLQYLADIAIEHADEWLSRVQKGEVHVPYQLIQLYPGREGPNTDLAVELGTLETPGRELEVYVNNEPEVSIREDGDKAKFELLNINYYPDEAIQKVEHFVVNYNYERPNGESRKIRIGMRRHVYTGTNKVYWNVWRVINYKPNSGDDEKFRRRRFIEDRRVQLPEDE